MRSFTSVTSENLWNIRPMYKIYGILEAEYPRPDYHRASGAKPLVGGQGAKPPEAKSNFIFGRPVEAATLWLWGGARAPCAPRGSANDSDDGVVVVVVDILRMMMMMMMTICRQHDSNSCIRSRWRSRFHRFHLSFSVLQVRRFLLRFVFAQKPTHYAKLFLICFCCSGAIMFLVQRCC